MADETKEALLDEEDEGEFLAQARTLPAMIAGFPIKALGLMTLPLWLVMFTNNSWYPLLLLPICGGLGYWGAHKDIFFFDIFYAGLKTPQCPNKFLLGYSRYAPIDQDEKPPLFGKRKA
jgi:type IV secretory pathway VirB3-like protein